MKLSEEIKAYYNEHRPLGAMPKSCYAPFKNLYFGSDGRVTACCFNRSYELGSFPKNTIREIWNGEKIKTLKEKLSEADFSLGCSGCYQQIVAKNIDGTKAKQYDENPLNSNNYPSVMEFELSNLCNLECIMCNGDYSSLIREKREKRPPLINPYTDEFVKQLEEFIPHLHMVKFYGGEPFLVDIYYKIWEKIIEIKPSIIISIQTNATILNQKVKRLLEKGNFHIGISIDSLKKEKYESIRINAKFERVIENILWFKEYTQKRNTFFGISACAMTNNWEELPAFVRFSNALNAQVYFHNLIYPSRLSLMNEDENQLKEVIDVLTTFSFEAKTPIEIKNLNHFNDYILQLKSYFKEIEYRVLIYTAEDFLSYYTIKIQADNALNENEKNDLISIFTEKINYVDSKINNKEILKEKLSNLDHKNNMIYDMIKKYFKELSNEEVFDLMMARI